jgi:uncharacterized protein (DUF779 family)
MGLLLLRGYATLVFQGRHELMKLSESLFYISASQYEYWKHTQLIIDVVPGRGGMFSLESSEGKRFLTRSRLFSDAEYQALKG